MAPMNMSIRLFRPRKHAAANNMLLRFGDKILSGIGQGMFQNCPITGAFLQAGRCVGGWQFGAYALLGTAAGSLSQLYYLA